MPTRAGSKLCHSSDEAAANPAKVPLIRPFVHRREVLRHGATPSVVSRECDGSHTSSSARLLESGSATSSGRQDADRARKPAKLASVLGTGLALAIPPA